MYFYKHYSFDLWLTLIKSNPEFKKQRAVFFHKHLNAKKKTIEEVQQVIRQVDVMCNFINEKTGRNIASDEMYLMVIHQLNNYEPTFSDLDMLWLQKEMENLFLHFLPFVYSNETYSTLDHIKQHQESTIGILSNTAFIEGKTLRKVLPELKLAQYFDFQLYSDETGLSKPNKSFFELMIKTASAERAEKAIQLNEILHIGDNPIADIDGGASVGINVFQINSNSFTIKHILN
ncbi:HAD family hydrolase [Emticicia sp. 17c]|uniref:HAD family hydrolase n=1 Tax=Emticicia sp. 17c TaxID=3127704 RepID=UPI00301DD96C